MKTILLLSLALFTQAQSVISSQQSVTVRFDDIDRPPADFLSFGPITITGNGRQVATVAGVGLGVVGFGGNGDVVRAYHYLPLNSLPDWIGDERITFTSGDGTLTLLPFSQNLGSPFSINYVGGGQYDIHFTDQTYPFSFDNPSTLYNSVNTDPDDWWTETYFNPIRSGDLSQELTIQFGFSVLSMEYTVVPEPSALALCALGLPFLWFGYQQLKA